MLNFIIIISAARPPAAPKKRKNYLKAANKSRISQLSDDARHYFLLHQKSRKKCLRQSKALNQQRLQRRDKKAVALDYLKRFLQPHQVSMVKRQIELNQKHPRGRRYTVDEKVLVLTVAKGGSRAVAALEKQMIVPSHQTSARLLRNVTLTTGFNDRLLGAVKKFVDVQPTPQDRCFILTWDEMSLNKSVCWNSRHKLFQGLEDFGSLGRSPNVCNSALILQIQGVKKRVKIPVAYVLAHKSTPAKVLAKLVTETILRLHHLGARVIAGVCDQAGTNRKCMELLGATAERPFFELNSQKIVLFNDPPHVGKRIGSMFRRYDVKLDEYRVAKIEHVRKLLEEKSSLCGTTLAPKLTKKHISAAGKWSMRVYLTYQLLSGSVAAGLNTLLAMGRIEISAAHTSTFISTMDSLLDSFNGNQKVSVKPLKAK